MSSKRKDFARFQSKATLAILIILGTVILIIIHWTDRPNQFKQSTFARRMTSVSDAISTENLNDDKEISSEHGEGDHAISHVVLFPWFAQLIGIFAYWIISRYAHGIPYTAVLFITGAMMGYYSDHSYGNAIVESMKQWLGINGEVIILTFLPGLLFLDSYNINVHLFIQSFWQLVVFAFPMVLGGTYLTALVAYYFFPYGWSFDLCMTFGSILAATDPVAVAVLLNELGAPSRLKIHISGESLMNDGSAVVFYHIFSSRFFYELGIKGFGEAIGWARGFALFFRLAFGGACIGLAFGVGLVTILFNLNRRLSVEENVVQVTSTITVAYLAFYVSEILAGCSGIISVLFCGVTTKAFGETLLNNTALTTDFWHITEHLLNTTLFCLGGAVWGGITSKSDWIYLACLYVAVIMIRVFLVFSFFPLTSRIGISQNWQEALFMSYGGLRGTVGVSLALLLSAQIYEQTDDESVSEETREAYRIYVDKLFAFSGGIAFLTLLVNGPTSAILLKNLGLVTPSETRLNVVKNYEQHMKINTLVEYMNLISKKRFEHVDFGVIREHVSPLQNITREEVKIAAESFKLKYPDKTPNFANLVPYLFPNESQLALTSEASTLLSFSDRSRSEPITLTRQPSKRVRETVYDYKTPLDRLAVLEQRLIFIDLLRREYLRQLDVSELDSRGFIPYSLLQSLEVAKSAASNGLPLCDWAASQAVSDSFTRRGDKLLHAYRVGRNGGDHDFHVIRTQVLQALSFIQAHRASQKTFKAEFASVNSNSLTLAAKAVLDESKDQVAKAESAINNFDVDDVSAIKSQYVCQILLYKSAHYFENLARRGLMTEKEATEYLYQYDLELRKLRLQSELKTEIRLLNNRISPELQPPGFGPTTIAVLSTIISEEESSENHA